MENDIVALLKAQLTMLGRVETLLIAQAQRQQHPGAAGGTTYYITQPSDPFAGLPEHLQPTAGQVD
jgi:hypothetical protein